MSQSIPTTRRALTFDRRTPMSVYAFSLAVLLSGSALDATENPPTKAPAMTSPTSDVRAIVYPRTRRSDDADIHFGERVADPYRWLENDVHGSAEVAAWIEAQNAVTDAHLATLPAREVFRKRLSALFDHTQLTAPQVRAGRYFHTRKSGLENQPMLYLRDAVEGVDRVLIDPNRWSDDGATSLAEWAPSPDGKRVVYGVQDGGSDWRTLRVIDVDSGRTLDDEVEWMRFSTLDWNADGSGFFYSRYPEPQGGATALASVVNHAVYFHAVGTAQSEDRLVYATPDQPHLLHNFTVTRDGRYMAIYSTPGSMTRSLTVIDLTAPAWIPRPVVANFDDEWGVVGSHGTQLFAATTLGAERTRIVALDMAQDSPVPVEVVPEQEGTLSDAVQVGGRLVATYLVDAKTRALRFRLDGTGDGEVPLPGIGSAGGFRGDPHSDETFFVFTSYNAPTTIYRYDVATGTRSVWAAPELAFDLDRVAVEQHFYASKDGTRVPLFIMRRKDVTTAAPTLLYAYGGFGINMIPVFSPAQLAWVEQGGVFAVANIRGGAEYGKTWHHEGRRENKQNVFDDFIAAGEFLKAAGITPADGLAILGESNGGLLVTAVVNQRPDLFAAALPGVPVTDMLRYHHFTGGQLWIPELGDPSEETSFRHLLAYSPYHNIVRDTPYPAILATTADADNRVIPAHTFKYIAALQAAGLGPRPQLARIETRAGHGAGKPTDKMIDEVADMWAFAARWSGLKVAPDQAPVDGQGCRMPCDSKVLTTSGAPIVLDARAFL